MTKHTVSARIALFLTVAALVPFAVQTGGDGAALLNEPVPNLMLRGGQISPAAIFGPRD
ncbi:MAG: hypothetical protein LBG27_14075 [Spirochaetaceae bacterium]|jgi:hypothetical protein|nr:hypothetical protein [Spirochaetaceae bacterium]